MRIALFSAISALAFATPAFAGGFHADVHGGWDRIAVAGMNDSGAAYGVALGYDMPIGTNAFVGIEGSADDASTKECVAGTCLKAGRDLSAVVRLGTKVGGNYTLYGLAGYANGRITVTGTGGSNGDGLRLGAGMQMGLTDNLFGKIEYRYTNYESGFTRNQVLAGFGVNF